MPSPCSEAGCPVGAPVGGYLVGRLAGEVVANPMQPDHRDHDALSWPAAKPMTCTITGLTRNNTTS